MQLFRQHVLDPRRRGAGLTAGLMAALLAAGVSAAPPDLPLRTLARGQNGAITQSGRQVIRDRKAWEALWKQQFPGSAGSRVPAVDFSREMVLAAFQGQQTTGGYAIAITGARLQGKQVVVTVEEQTPPPDAITTQALTSPFHFVAVKRSPLSVKWTARRH